MSQRSPAGREHAAPPARLAVRMLAAHILSMLGFSSFAALLPELRDLWGLTNAQAGLVGGAFFAGYVGTVSYWTALTDRVHPARVYLAGCLLAAAGSAGFGLFADGLAGALAFQTLLGAGIAATYMPGLRLLSDRISGPGQSRYIAFYTSFFGIGLALSLALAGTLAPAAGWRAAFLVAALGPVLAGWLVWRGMASAGEAAHPRAREGEQRGGVAPSFRAKLGTLFPLGAWRRVLAHRAAAGYALGYAVHCLELFGSRAWIVAFLVFAAGLHVEGSGAWPWNAALVAAAVNLLGVPASILGNEAALRVGRRSWILVAMLGSGASGIVLGLAAPAHWLFVLALLAVYSMLVMAESATLTAGMIAAAPAELRGAAMGLYSLAGFAGGMLGPVVFGAALDAAGGADRHAAWVIGYAAIGAGCLAAPLVARAFALRRGA